MTETELKPIAPTDALEWYLEDKESEYSEKTLEAHEYRLGHFLRWCDKTGIENLNEIDGRKVHRFKTWRTNEGGLNRVSQRTQLSSLRVFLTWCSDIDAVAPHVAEQVQVPSVDKHEKKRTKDADPELILNALDYLRRYEYASNKHVALELMWHTALRVGGLYGLDVDDYHPRKSYIKVNHRPEQGTPLKNKRSGERAVNLSDGLCNLLDDYLDTQRPDVRDDYGRKPLLATQYGRVARQTIRAWTYRATRPCEFGEGCPSNHDTENCEYLENERAAACPHNVHPHAIRGASITYHRNQGWPVEHLSGRVNASPSVIKDHYDEPDDEEEIARRRDFMEKL